jgi:hypothetical protein
MRQSPKPYDGWQGEMNPPRFPGEISMYLCVRGFYSRGPTATEK